MFPRRLTKIDELTRRDHSFLEEADAVYFLGEYTARKGFAHSETNQLIANFKKPVDRRGKPEYAYKDRAIREAAAAFVGATGNSLKPMTLVPIPPSKCKTDPLYDDRMVQMLRAFGAGFDIRELVIQTQSMDASHLRDDRPKPEDLAAGYSIDESLCNPVPTAIAIFDDVLTTGSHFRAMSLVLRNRFPGIPLHGLFIARRAPEAIDIEFDVIDF